MIGTPQNHENPQSVTDVAVDLTIHRGRARRLVRPVHGPVFTIGAEENCDMVLGDEQFPDIHSYVCVRSGVVSLRYLGAGPPVTVNGREVRWGELRDADRIRTGPYEFRVGIRYVTDARSGDNWNSLTGGEGIHVGRF